MSTAAFPPLARSRLPGQMLWRFQRDRLGTLTRLAREQGDLVRIPTPTATLFLVSRPEWIRRVLETDHRHYHKGRGLENAALVLGRGLLTSEGELHAEQRRLMMPAFHRQQILRYGQDMVALTERHIAGWQPGRRLDMAAEMMRLTRAIVARSLFDEELSGEDEAIDEALAVLVGSFGVPGAMMAPLWMVERGWLPGTRRLPAARRALEQLIGRMIAERRSAPEGRADLLTMLVHAADESGRGMDDRQLRDELLTLFLAGHETTANALTWTLYLLGEHPEALARLQAELDRVLDGRPPEVEDLSQLVYARQVLTESMRLYPPAWILGRRAIVDRELGGFGIPRGAILLLSPYIVQRDGRWFEEPARFRPERWAGDLATRLPKYAYFPFGGGPRRCIGEAFAWMEGVLVLATIARSWSARLVPGHPVLPEPLITLRPRRGMPMRLQHRDAGRRARAARTLVEAGLG